MTDKEDKSLQETDPVDNMDEEEAAKTKLTSGDPSKVQFTPITMDSFDGKNGEARVEIQITQGTVGMGKEELMKFANEPFWVNLRMILFFAFWFLWIAMLVGAVVIILLAPRCPAPPTIEWHQKALFYQANIKTFKDSNNDGIGDINGLISKLSYFKDHNIGAIMLSSFYKSENKDEETIIDHKQLDETIGTLEDFETLIDELKKNDIKLVVDFNPNHSSKKHNWFRQSQSKQPSYADFYVWRDGDGNNPPNNWLNVDSDSAWKWDGVRKQYYLSTFGGDTADLNLTNPLVRQELKEIITFWLEKGVDGFRVVAASHLVESKDMRDEALSVEKQTSSAPKYQDLNHAYTVDQPENIGLFAEWREILNNFTASTGIYKILVPEVTGTVNTTALYFGNSSHKLADFPYTYHMTDLKSPPLTGMDLKRHLAALSEHLPPSAWPANVLGSKKVSRLRSRVGIALVDAIHMIGVLAEGTPIIYYGDELGISDNRQGAKLVDTVMLWSNNSNAGFTNGSTDYSVHTDYKHLNVHFQEQNPKSHLKVLQKLLTLRSQAAINFGLQEYPIVTDNIFSILRVRKGSPGYLGVVNLSEDKVTLDFSEKSKHLPDIGRVEVRSGNIDSGYLIEGDHPKIYLNSVELGPQQSVVFSVVPVFE